MSKVWVAIAQGGFGEPDILAFKEEDKALRYAFKWIMERTGGPSAWRPDEWPQMRAAIAAKDAASMIEYYNASIQGGREFFHLEQVPLR